MATDDTNSIKMRILIVDDQNDLFEFSNKFLPRSYSIEHMRSAKAALDRLQRGNVDLVLLDKDFKNLGEHELIGPVEQSKVEGLTFLKSAKDYLDSVPVIMVTGKADMASTKEALTLGAFDYIEWEALGLDSTFLARKVRRALEWKNAKRNELIARFNGLGLIGSSPPMVKLFSTIEQVAGSGEPVLIQGESGTGKELAANIIHTIFAQRLSASDNEVPRPFVPINCAAIPRDLFESELFGIKKKTATGVDEKIGKLQLADRGTAFLDEIGDMPVELQSKLLRVMEQKTLDILGKSEPLEINVRIVAATSKDLEKAVQMKTFSEALYYRLAGHRIYLPSLEQRKQDIVPLAEHFIRVKNQVSDKCVQGMTERVKEEIQSRRYRGNVRQLKQLIFAAMDFADNIITLRNLLDADGVLERAPISSENNRSEALNGLCSANAPNPACPLLSQSKWEEIEKAVIQEALSRNGNSVKKAAEQLGLAKQTLYDKIARYGIERAGE